MPNYALTIVLIALINLIWGYIMQIDVSAEVLLSQLSYSKNEASLKQAQKVIDETKGYEKFAKHILSLNDNLKKLNAYVALSNSTNYLKIKCENDSKDILDEFHDIVLNWSSKYNVNVEKLAKKNVYYILGITS